MTLATKILNRCEKCHHGYFDVCRHCLRSQPQSLKPSGYDLIDGRQIVYCQFCEMELLRDKRTRPPYTCWQCKRWRRCHLWRQTHQKNRRLTQT